MIISTKGKFGVYSRILISLGMGILLSIIMICTALAKDDNIECKVIYNFFQQIEDEPHLYIQGDKQLYDIPPHTPETDTYKTIWTWYEVSYKIPYEAFPMKQFSLELLKDEGEAEVLSIEFYNHGYQVAKFSAEEIYNLFDANASEIQVSDSSIKYKAIDDKIVLQGNENLSDIFQDYLHSNRSLYMNSIFWGIVMAIFIYCIWTKLLLYKSNERSRNQTNKKEILLAIALIVVFCLSCAMSFFSKHYSHPDEPVTRMAIDYYLAQWRFPDMSSSWVAGTSSIYGVSRLSEKSIYYFLAGKTGWIFREFLGIGTYYRVFNLLLIGCMLCICWKKCRKHRWMPIALCMSPQLWYIYSYATSDAWDWFCGFIMIYMLLEHKNVLFQGSIYKKFIVCLSYSLIFSMLFLGKTNYYVLLGIAFVDFLVEWIQQKEGKFKAFLLYFAILTITFGLKVGIEHIPTLKQEYIYKEQNQKELTNEIDTGYNYWDEYEEYLVPSLYTEGVSLHDMLWNYSTPPTLVMLFASATGCYMWMSLYSGKLYTCVMGVIYLALIISMMYTIWKHRKGNFAKNVKVIWAYFVCLLAIIITILYCWIVTYQPQGRYILALWLIVGYICSQYDEILRNKVVRIAVIIGYIASCFSFTYYGLLAMMQQGYLLN